MNPKLKSFARAIKRNVPFILVVFGIIGFRTGYADWSPVPTGSMEPTIVPGDYIWVDKTAFGPSLPIVNVRLFSWGTPERGDIITFVPPHTDELYVKRVIGVPGDVVRFDDRDVFVNGERLQTVYAPAAGGAMLGTERIGDRLHHVLLSTPRTMPSIREPIEVPEGRYFVMGDHRDDSLDSRAWGFVEADRIMGRATHVAVSFGAERPLRERFAQRLR